MYAIRTVTVAVCLLIGSAGMPAAENRPVRTPDDTDVILEDAPLTIVFRKVTERGVFDGAPDTWCWSINSAGQAELTVEFSANLASLNPNRATRKQLKISAKQMAGIRKALRDERFFHLKKEYGTCYIHGGWSTLTVVAGRLNKSVHYSSSWAWPHDWKREKRAELVAAAPAIRIWLKVCETVDPDGKVFTERQKVAEALRALKK